MDLPLGALLDRGMRAITLACRCGHQATVAGLEHVVPRTILLSQIGARLRCRACGRKGCEARPWQPPAPAFFALKVDAGYRAFLAGDALPSKSRRRFR